MPGAFFKLDFCYMYAIAKFQKCEVNSVPKMSLYKFNSTVIMFYHDAESNFHLVPHSVFEYQVLNSIRSTRVVHIICSINSVSSCNFVGNLSHYM